MVNNKNADDLALKTWGVHEDSIPPWQKSLLKISLPLLKKFLITILRISKENALESLKKAEVLIEDMDKMLVKNNYVLGTDEPTFLDYAYASILGIVVFPDQYGGPSLSAESRFKVTDMNQEVQKYSKKFKNTPSGKFTLKMYSENR